MAQLGTSLLGIGLNGVMIARYFYARSMASLAYTWRSVYVQTSVLCSHMNLIDSSTMGEAFWLERYS